MALEDSSFPKTTRLRYATAKTPQQIVEWLDAIGVRVHVYGQPVWDGKRWVLWFVPNDRGADIQPIELDKI